MVSLPPRGILIAAERWGTLLTTSSLTQARSLLESDTRYLDLSGIQYDAALDWLIDIGILMLEQGPPRLRGELMASSAAELKRAIFRAGLERAHPAWLTDADLHVETAIDIPADGDELASALGVPARDAVAAIRQVHGKVDLKARAEVGLAGELALVALLESGWPGSARHVAATDDGLGYDIAVNTGAGTWHLEVKTAGGGGGCSSI